MSNTPTPKMFRLAIALALVLLTACSSAGSEYLGKWENVKNPKDAFTVARNGESFLVIKRNRNFLDERDLGEAKLPATLENGMLTVQGGMGAATFAYIAASDTISVQSFAGSQEFKRQE